MFAAVSTNPQRPLFISGRLTNGQSGVSTTARTLIRARFALLKQLEQAGIPDGPLFRSLNPHGHVQNRKLSGVDVARIVKKLAERAGLDAAKYAGHSRRAGHATSAAIAGASERSIINQTGHRSVQMVRRYIREGSLFRENSAAKLGL
jgi:integrase